MGKGGNEVLPPQTKYHRFRASPARNPAQNSYSSSAAHEKCDQHDSMIQGFHAKTKPLGCQRNVGMQRRSSFSPTSGLGVGLSLERASFILRGVYMCVSAIDKQIRAHAQYDANHADLSIVAVHRRGQRCRGAQDSSCRPMLVDRVRLSRLP